jgi:hypothetical protein
MRTIAAGIVLATAVTSAWASDKNPRREAYEQSAVQLEELVDSARDGRLSQEQLRRERRRVETRLERRLDAAPADMKPGDMREVAAARAEMNQAIIQSQEYEFFGPEDRPEWGWYPSRAVQSTGSTLTVEKNGRSTYSVLK